MESRQSQLILTALFTQITQPNSNIWTPCAAILQNGDLSVGRRMTGSTSTKGGKEQKEQSVAAVFAQSARPATHRCVILQQPQLPAGPAVEHNLAASCTSVNHEQATVALASARRDELQLYVRQAGDLKTCSNTEVTDSYKHTCICVSIT